MLVGMPKENQSQSGHPQPAVDSTEGKQNERKCINYLRKSGCKSLAKNYLSVLSEGTNGKYWDGRKTASKEGLCGRRTPVREPCWTNYWTPPSSSELLGKSMLLCENNLHLATLKITVGLLYMVSFHLFFFFFPLSILYWILSGSNLQSLRFLWFWNTCSVPSYNSWQWVHLVRAAPRLLGNSTGNWRMDSS